VPEGLADDELQTAHRLATMATLGILTHRTARRQELLTEQLQHALDVRTIIEQAKGVVAERAGVTMSTAAELLRSAARTSRRPLAVVSRDVIEGKLPTDGPKGRAAVPPPRPPRQA
jgi:AmiR/NasT family two-component response regulator